MNAVQQEVDAPRTRRRPRPMKDPPMEDVLAERPHHDAQDHEANDGRGTQNVASNARPMIAAKTGSHTTKTVVGRIRENRSRRSLSNIRHVSGRFAREGLVSLMAPSEADDRADLRRTLGPGRSFRNPSRAAATRANTRDEALLHAVAPALRSSTSHPNFVPGSERSIPDGFVASPLQATACAIVAPRHPGASPRTRHELPALGTRSPGGSQKKTVEHLEEAPEISPRCRVDRTGNATRRLTRNQEL